MRHIPVLSDEVLRVLAPMPEQVIVDGTLGDGGHAEKILAAMGEKGTLVGFDADPEALLRAKHYLERFTNRVVYIRENVRFLHRELEKHHIGAVDGILLDLGWSTPQFEERGRGFSFQRDDEPLDMRYGGSSDAATRTAADFLQHAEEEDVERVLRMYGEESLAKEIAYEIMDAKEKKQLKLVRDLKEAVLRAYRKKLKTEKEVPWIGGLHPATKTFQAIRIAVNDELRVVEEVLPQALRALRPGGKLLVITFHSLEDRIVKHTFKDHEGKGFTLITKKPIICGEEEWKNNAPSRSAKLRAIQKM